MRPEKRLNFPSSIHLPKQSTSLDDFDTHNTVSAVRLCGCSFGPREERPNFFVQGSADMLVCALGLSSKITLFLALFGGLFHIHLSIFEAWADTATQVMFSLSVINAGLVTFSS